MKCGTFFHLYMRNSDYYMWNHSIVCERDSNSMAFILTMAKKDYKTATIKHTFWSIGMFKQFTVVVSFFAQNWYRFVNSIMKWIIIWSLVVFFFFPIFPITNSPKCIIFTKHTTIVCMHVCALFSLFFANFYSKHEYPKLKKHIRLLLLWNKWYAHRFTEQADASFQMCHTYISESQKCCLCHLNPISDSV